jgi:hypothetical protein
VPLQMREKGCFMGIVDQFYKGIGDAVKDIREKVVEEPWYGRTLTGPEAEAPQWLRAMRPENERSAEQEHDRNSVDTDIDR